MRGKWLATSFVTGAVIMVLELTAFRLYAPYFGYSTYVWGSMIGVVMIALTLGYAAGGWLADKSEGDAPLYTVIALSGVYQAAVLLTVSALMTRFAQLGPIAGQHVHHPARQIARCDDFRKRQRGQGTLRRGQDHSRVS